MKTVTAAILRHDDRILLARRSDGSQAGRWEFPGGKVEPGETDEACLARELREELGIDTEIGALFAESIYTYEAGRIRLRAYEVRWLSGALRAVVHDRLEWVPAGELLRYDMLPADVPIAEKLQQCMSSAP